MKKVVKEVMDCIVAVGEMIVAVFHDHQDVNLDQKVRRGRGLLLRIWRPDFVDKPTMHIGLHYQQQAKDIGNLKNARVGPKETAHGKAKMAARASNNFALEKDFLIFDNQASTMRALLKNEIEGIQPGSELLEIVKDPKLVPLFRDWLFEVSFFFFFCIRFSFFWIFFSSCFS